MYLVCTGGYRGVAVMFGLVYTSGHKGAVVMGYVRDMYSEFVFLRLCVGSFGQERIGLV
jgi:hypothetical protein